MKSNIGASEPLYGFIVWVVSNLGIERDYFLALINGFFAVGLAYLGYKLNFKWYYILFLLLNYYIMVLMFSAERLKFGFLFLTLGLCAENKNIKNCFFLFSLLCHFQIIIIYICYGFYFILKEVKKVVFTSKISMGYLLSLPLFFLLFIAFCYFFYVPISTKLMIYLKDGSDIGEYLKIIALMFSSLFIFKSKSDLSKFFVFIVPIVFLIGLIGGYRVNILAFFILVYIYARGSKGSNVILTFILVYFFIKAIVFVNNVLVYGTGFPPN
ncbi:hypothetical protein QTO01_00670 [Vibrio mytili]|uniref:hypothetical protein n=1 Tax=Vibrio mytili TaxID=50718 RepID=UPI002F41F2BC